MSKSQPLRTTWYMCINQVPKVSIHLVFLGEKQLNPLEILLQTPIMSKTSPKTMHLIYGYKIAQPSTLYAIITIIPKT